MVHLKDERGSACFIFILSSVCFTAKNFYSRVCFRMEKDVIILFLRFSSILLIAFLERFKQHIAI